MRLLFTIVAASLALSACGQPDTATPKAPVGDEAALAVDMNDEKADSARRPTFKGEIEFDTAATGTLTRREAFHVYLFDGQQGAAAHVDLTSDGDTYLMLYRDDGRRWTRVAQNDDCERDTLDSCLDLDLPADGQYALLATSYQAAVRGRKPRRLDYRLELACGNALCGSAPQACGSRGLDACAGGDYCDFPHNGCGRADGPGVCTERPSFCTRELRPVCGCDGQTYGNPCSAASAGVDVSHDGECEDPGAGEGQECAGVAGIQCARGLVCDMSENDLCGGDLGGTCVRPEPVACPRNVRPVCGCDGNTYNNDCERAAAFVPKAHDGVCPGAAGSTCGGIAALRCHEGLVCDMSGVLQCHPDMAGVCRSRDPVRACTQQYDPVCGCDGHTYGNDCMRRGNHAARAHVGECDPR